MCYHALLTASRQSRQSRRRKGSPRDTFNSGLCQLGGAVGVKAADGAVVVDENLVLYGSEGLSDRQTVTGRGT